jgi:hypothetical protein
MAKAAVKNLAKIFLNEATSNKNTTQSDTSMVDELVKNLSDLVHDSNHIINTRGFDNEGKPCAAECADDLEHLRGEKDRLIAEMASMQSTLQSLDSQCMQTEVDMKNRTMEEMQMEYKLKERELADLRADYVARLEDYKVDMLETFEQMHSRDRKRLGKGIEEMKKSVGDMTLDNIVVGDEEDMDEPEIIKQQYEMNKEVLEAELREIGYRVMETVTGRSLAPQEEVEAEADEFAEGDEEDVEATPVDVRDLFPDFVRSVYSNLKDDGVDAKLNEADLQQSINEFCEDASMPESFVVHGNDDDLEGFVVDE